MHSQNRLPKRVRSYLFTRRLLGWIQNGVKAVHRGFFLGFLDPADLQELTDNHYASSNADPSDFNYHESAYNLSGLRPWELRAIEQYFGDCRSILVGSAGGGREVLALSRMGFSIDAFECNPKLADACRSFLKAQGAEATVIQAEPGRVPAKLGIYDGAFLGWGAYIHIVGRERRIGLLRKFRQHLGADASLLLSFWTRSDSISMRVSYRLAKLIRAIRRAEQIEFGDSISTTFDHFFTESDIREELAEGGFDMIFYSEESYGHAVGRAQGSS